MYKYAPPRQPVVCINKSYPPRVKFVFCDDSILLFYLNFVSNGRGWGREGVFFSSQCGVKKKLEKNSNDFAINSDFWGGGCFLFLSFSFLSFISLKKSELTYDMFQYLIGARKGKVHRSPLKGEGKGKRFGHRLV